MICKPCNLKQEEKIFAKARNYFEAEVDIVDFLKRIRRLEALNTLGLERNHESDFKAISLREHCGKINVNLKQPQIQKEWEK